MISLKNVSYQYRKSSFDALSAINAEISTGIHLLLGENGAGKTTLLHIIAGLRFPTSGSCDINGVATSPRTPALLSDTFILTDDMRFPAKTINEMSRIHACFYPGFSKEGLVENLAEFGMNGDEALDSMSLGTRKKAYLAYVLSLNVATLLLDEPTNGLDIAARKTLRRLLSRVVSPEQTVIISTHSVGDLEVLYDGVIVLQHGKIILAAETDSILSRLCFTTTPTAPAEAIYSEPDMGMTHAITVNAEGEPLTSINFPLLYMALQTPVRLEILKILKNEDK